MNIDEQAVVWWIIAFTCVFETLHSLSARAIAWLLSLLGCLLTFLSRYSDKIANIAHAFPSTIYKRSQYLKERINIPSVCNYVVCLNCLSLYKYDDCLQKRGARTVIKECTECAPSLKQPLLKEIDTSNGNRKYYPHLVYPNASLISCMQFLLLRRSFYQQCQQWHQTFLPDSSILSDVYDGKVWKDFFYLQEEVLDKKDSICFMLNIDWFQPFKHRVYSIGVIYLAIMNLPRSVRFKRENIIIVGLLPGPKEPSKNINSYLTPLVSDLLALWDGIEFKTYDSVTRLIRCALLCIGCDLPAGRKTCGFLTLQILAVPGVIVTLELVYLVSRTILDLTGLSGYSVTIKNIGMMLNVYLLVKLRPQKILKKVS